MTIKARKGRLMKKVTTGTGPKASIDTGGTNGQPQKKVVEVVSDTAKLPNLKSADPVVPDTKDIIILSEGKLSLANTWFIENSEGMIATGVLLKEIKDRKKKVDEWLLPQKQATYISWQTANGLFNKAMNPLKDAEKILKDKMSAFQLVEADKQEKANISPISFTSWPTISATATLAATVSRKSRRRIWIGWPQKG